MPQPCECEEKFGRLLDLCLCKGQDGRPDPPLEHCNHWREQWGLAPLATPVTAEWNTTRKSRGLGDTIAKITSAFGIKPCGGCKGRQKALNRLIPFGSPSVVPLVGVPIDRSKLISNILYHVMPLAGAAEWIWRRHADWLREVRPQFNGRMIIGIVTKSPSDPWQYCNVESVKSAFSGMDAEFIVVQNDHGSAPRRGRGEGMTFLKMLGMIQTDNPNEVFFYGHAKAVTHGEQPLGAPVHLWTESLFEASFRNRDAMIDALDRHGIVGSFRVSKTAERSSLNGWHYAGTFWACRSADVFRRNWQQLKSFYGCVEMWPNGVFAEHEGACLFLDAIQHSRLLYTPNYWSQTVTPAWEHWKSSHDQGSLPVTTMATVVFNPSPACIANINQIFADGKRHLGETTQTIVIDNSPQPAEGIVADVYHWNGGDNNFWGGAINQAVQLATGDRFIHFSSQRTRVRDHRWMERLLSPLLDPSCGMAGPVQAVQYRLIGERNPRPGHPEVHIQQSVFAARTEVLKRFPWGARFPHTYSDVWSSWNLIKHGFRLVNVPEVTSAAGLEKCKPGAMLECVTEKL